MRLAVFTLLLGCASSEPITEDAGPAADCIEGDTRCQGSSLQVCGSDARWSVPQTCGPGAFCTEGRCSSDCEGCQVGADRCSAQGQQRCLRDDTGCGRWSLPVECNPGWECQGERCAQACAASCNEGDRRCDGPDGYVTCEVDGACTRWGARQACAEGSCSGGECVGECQDQCQEGMMTCQDERNAQRCERLATGCLDWGSPSPCEAGRCRPGVGCDDGACAERPCDEGEVRCVDLGVQRCITDAAGCPVWGAIEDCGAGRQCVEGSCTDQGCQDACAAGDRRCAEGGVQFCDREGACLAWGAVMPCPFNQMCRGGGECGECSEGEQESQPCGNCGTQGRTCRNGDWTDWGACDSEGECRPGEVEACGGCGTRECHGRCGWGECSAEGECAPGETRDCGQCGMQTCQANCSYDACNNGDGRLWRECNACGWQFCCPNGSWCDCAARFDCPGGQSCVGAGVCQ